MLKKTQLLIAFTSVLSIINGIAYLFFSQISLDILGVNASEFGILITRYYGACAIGYGVLLWQIRQVNSYQANRSAIFSILILLGPSSIIGLFGVINGIFNQVGWLFVLTDFILSIASAIIYLGKHNSYPPDRHLS